jgi:spore germination protein GerM
MMTPTRIRLRGRVRASVVALLVVLGLAAAACAVPTQSSPSAFAPAKVPFGLLDKIPPTTTTTQPKSLVPVKVFFVDATNALTPAQRYVANPAPVSAVIEAMLAGPSVTEARQGLTSAIPSNVALLSATTTQPNIVTVNMNTAFGEITGTNAELAVAQIVATVTTETGYGTGVLFEIDGQRIPVPTANGSEVSGPVYIYAFLNGAT